MPSYADWSASQAQEQQPGSMTAFPSTAQMELDGGVQESVISDLRQRRISESGQQRQHADSSNSTQEDAVLNGPLTWDRNREMPKTTILLVIDTNWLINHLHVFHTLESLIPVSNQYSPLVFIVSAIVLRELDGLKNDHRHYSMPTSQHAADTASLARRASSALLTFIEKRPDLFRGQRAEEGLFGQHHTDKNSDERILDCCQHYQQHGFQVGLLTDDTILSVMAQSSGVPHLCYEIKDRDPQNFLRKLHPELYPYFQTAQAAKGNSSANMQVQADPRQILRSLRDVEESLMAQYRAHYPLLPMDLLLLITRTAGLLLAPSIFITLLTILANDDLETFAYMLERMSIFRDLQPMDIKQWDGCVCLRLLDSNWACFSERTETSPPEASESGTLGASTNPSSSAGRIATGSAGVSASRWASSNVRRSTSGPSISTSSSTASGFHPSKISALVSSLATASDPQGAQSILKWSSARWSVLLEDLEILLCKTCILPEPDDRRRARIWLDTWKSNVASWKS